MDRTGGLGLEMGIERGGGEAGRERERSREKEALEDLLIARRRAKERRRRARAVRNGYFLSIKRFRMEAIDEDRVRTRTKTKTKTKAWTPESRLERMAWFATWKVGPTTKIVKTM